jgi:hypothetical protein
MLPNLITIGAMKSATSSLHYYLDLHPEISMSKRKELDFFVAEKIGIKVLNGMNHILGLILTLAVNHLLVTQNIQVLWMSRKG